MLLLTFICPFLYSLMVGSAWSLWFRKRFSSSLSLAYMVHILIVLLSGLIFKRLSIGIYGGVIIAAVMLFLYGFKIIRKHELSVTNMGNCAKKLWGEGVLIFSIFYVFCFLINSGKRFIAWDEFSHWGMFLKESIRLDCFYCMSPKQFFHKDYVPAITLFETIWCKLGFRYAESDVYRGIQVFMFSLLLPMFESFECFDLYSLNGDNDGRCASKLRNIKSQKRLLQIGSVSIVLLIPLLFNTSNAFWFYHSIYCDIVVGILFYWCAFESYKKFDGVYSFLTLTIGISVLVLAKMTAIALVPLVMVLFFVKVVFFHKKRKIFIYLNFIPTIGVPLVLWWWFNTFVERHIGKLTGIQNYGGIKISSLIDVFINPDNGAIPYLEKVKNAFIDAVIHRDILLHGSYAVVVIFIVFALFALAAFAVKQHNKKAITLVGIWMSASGIYYAVLMYFLYATAFSEDEATNLASFERYMNSFVIAAVFLLVAVYYDSEVWKNHIKGFYFILIFMTVDLAFLHAAAFDQVLPGNITRDAEKIKTYTDSASIIMNSTTDDDRIYVVKRDSDADYFIIRERYYCNPRTIGGGSIGPMVNENDTSSKDIDVTELVEDLKEYDYIYFASLDEAFLTKYSDAFEDPAQLVNGQIYKIVDVGESKVKLSQ